MDLCQRSGRNQLHQGLTPETTYEVQVQAVSDELIESDWTESVRFTTLAEQPKTNVYILGEVNENAWAPNVGLPMDVLEEGVYTANITCDGRNEGYNYFSFTTVLAENNDQGGWDFILPFRFGAVSEGDFDVTDEMLGIELALTYEGGQAYKIPAGEYMLKVDLNNMKLIIYELAESREISGIVYDAAGIPLEGVLVTATPVAEVPEGMKRADSNISFTTGLDGRYSLTVPADGEYTLTFEKEGYATVTLPEAEAEVVTMEPLAVAINDVNAKAVANVKYVNVAGQVSSVAFEGVNLQVTTYTDGSKSIVKVVK